MEEEAANIDWVPLAESLDEMDAEMARGYLEAQGIPVQLKSSNKGLSNYRGSVATAGYFLRIDLYVPRDQCDSAILVLRDMPKVEPLIGDHEDFVLVYDEAGELQELDLSADGKCPACGGIGIEHKVAKRGGAGLFYLVCVGIVPLAALLNFVSDKVFGVSDLWVVMLVSFWVLMLAALFVLRDGKESWYCARCRQEWHK